MASTTTNKVLAVIGFVLAIIFLLWLAVKIVTLLPAGFSSLASIADSVQNYRPTKEIAVSTPNSVVNADDSFIITWSEINNDGVLAFTYDCTSEARLSTVTEGDVQDIACDEAFVITGQNDLEVAATSQEQRFTDLTYTLTFTPERGDVVTATDTITIVNATIPAGGTDADETTDETADAGDNVATPEPTTPSEPTGTPETYYRTVEQITYEIPTSDPNGYTDLEVKFIGVGTIDNNGNFRRTYNLRADEAGALRFYVKNTGTKTSADWTFAAELPTGADYQSGRQAPLKPNEQSVLTIRFDEIDETGVASFAVEVDTDRDSDVTNNQLTWAVSVTN